MAMLSGADLDVEAVQSDLTDDDILVVKTREGRAAARPAWMWNGTPTSLTLSWNPDGTQHDYGQKYLSKKHCLCCGDSGFRQHCLKCRKNSCSTCQQGRDKSKIIPCFYLNKEDVPYQANFYGNVDCFLPMCARRDSQGFQSAEDMRMHARSRHKMEYQAYMETIQANKADELDILRGQINALMSAAVHGNAPVDVPIGEAVKIAEDLLVIKNTVLDELEAPLYVSDKPAKPKKARKKRAQSVRNLSAKT